MKQKISFLDLIFGFSPLCATGFGPFTMAFADGGGGGGGDGGDGGGDGGGSGGDGGGGDGGTTDYSKITMADIQGLVPEDLRENGVFSKYTEVPEFFKGITELATLAGKKGDIPTDWEDEAAVGEFWKKLGRGDAAADYDFQLPENFTIPKEYVEKLAEAAFNANMPKSMFAKFIEPIIGYEAELAKGKQEESNNRKTAAQARLSEEWGESSEDMLAEVDNVLSHLKLPEADIKAIKGNVPALLAMGKVAQMLGERGQAGATFGKTKAGLSAQLEEVNGKITEKLGSNGRNMNDPTLQPLLEKRERLQDRING